MKLSVLVNNDVNLESPYFYGEPGLSYYIEAGGKRGLFDTGYSDVALKNAEKLGIDLNGLDFVALSHGHDDHARGLKYLHEAGIDFSKTELILHPQALVPKWDGEEYIGIPYTETELSGIFGRVTKTREPYEIAEGLWFLGEIPRENDFENKSPVCEVESPDGGKVPDFLIDDSALCYAPSGSDEIYLISGCAHSGICNVSEYAKKISGREKVRGIIGGFHMTGGIDERVEKTIDYLKILGAKELYPGHCCLFHARAEMYKRLNTPETPVRDMYAGMSLTL